MQFPKLHCSEELTEFLQEVGFLPLLPCGIECYSVFSFAAPVIMNMDTENNPWEWRYELAGHPDIAYGKFFGNKIGFISKEWYPCFANIRRDGCDFDVLYEEGKLSYQAAQLMNHFPDGTRLPSWELRQFVPGNELEKVLTELQMRGYLVTAGFEQKRNRYGEGYGWPCSVYTTPETLFGADFVYSSYDESPEESLARAMEHCFKFCIYATEKQLRKFLTG